jgi:acetyltransferase
MGNIRKLLNPKTIALIGATDKEDSLGRTAMENLLLSKDRMIFPVNPCRTSVLGIPCYPHISDVPEHIDLAIIITPADTVPGLLETCGESGIEGIIIVSVGFTETGPVGKALEDKILEIRKKYGMRIVGPGSMGIIRPNGNLNASIMHSNPEKGKIAFISQGGTFGRALLDWGISAHMGFSLFASLGSMTDVDIADLIDYLGEDPQTRNIMIYAEDSVGSAKNFMSAARGFARNKPIIILKPGLPMEEHGEARTHTGVLANSEHVYDAVFRRTGVVRVGGVVDLFNAASVLYARHLPRGPRLLIITNAGGVVIMAINTLLEFGGELAVLSAETLESLDLVLPPYWNRVNPLDILRDANVERFINTLNICLKDPGVDGVLIIFTPQEAASSDELAQAVAVAAKEAWKPVIAAWIGGKEVRKGRDLLLRNSIPTYDTPEEVVKTYLYMYNYKRNLALLYETPAELPVDHTPPKNNLKAFVRRAAGNNMDVLSEADSMRFLTSYGIPVLKSQTIQTVEEAVRVALEIGYPVALKVSSPDIIFRIDVGGVITGITSEQALREEYEKLLERVKVLAPDARIKGIIVQKMLEKIDYEVIVGSKKDRDFGSVILFGMGGIAVQIFKTFSIGLPPLNQILARRLMEESKMYKMLNGYRNKPPADMGQLEQIIVSFSNMIVDFPEIAESDINPIAISNGRAYALDARIVLDKNCLNPTTQYPHLVITPYPTRYIVPWTLPDGSTLLFRPIKPEDEPLIDQLYAAISEESFRGRFFQASKHASHEMHIRQCNIDYDREMGIVAEIKEHDKRRLLGIGMLVTEANQRSAEYAVLVHDDYQGKGLGYKLVDILIGIAQEKGLDEIYGFVLADNRKMLGVAKKLGFIVEWMPDNINRVKLLLK